MRWKKSRANGIRSRKIKLTGASSKQSLRVSLHIGFPVVAAFYPEIALADICGTLDPNWDGLPVSALQELVSLAATPPALILLIATAFVIRFKHQWGALVVVVLWTIYASALTMFDPTGIREPAMAEGCVGSNTVNALA